MSASAITDAIITNLTATSALGSDSTARHYRVLETTSACCAVVSWQSVLSAPITFGTTSGRNWVHAIEMYLKDTGDPISLMQRNSSFIDTVLSSLESDGTLQDTVETISEIRGNRVPGEAYSVGGATWLPTTVLVTSTEFS